MAIFGRSFPIKAHFKAPPVVGEYVPLNYPLSVGHASFTVTTVFTSVVYDPIFDRSEIRRVIEAVLAEEGATTHDTVDIYLYDDSGDRIDIHFSDARIIVSEGISDWNGFPVSDILYEPYVTQMPTLKFVENRGMENAVLNLSNMDGHLSEMVQKLGNMEGAGIVVSRAFLSAEDNLYYSDELCRGYITQVRPTGDDFQITLQSDMVVQGRKVSDRYAFDRCPYTFNAGLRPTTMYGTNNVALTTNGAVFSASSEALNIPDGNGGYLNFPKESAGNGDRIGANWGNGGGWSSAPPNLLPQWLSVTFPEEKLVNKIVIVTLQDGTPVEPTTSTTFTQSGITDFDVSYWNGDTSQWVSIQTFTANNKVLVELNNLNIHTTQIKVNVTGSKEGGGQGNVYARIVELEAWIPEDLVNMPAPPDGETEQDLDPCGWQTTQGYEVGASPTTCDKTRLGSNGCRAHRNEFRYGGFDLRDTIIEDTTSTASVIENSGWGTPADTGRRGTYREPTDYAVW